MRIISITAGAGGMYCGSCIRDNALAKSLGQLGHEAILVPLYTPPRTDGPSVSEERVFFGGISVYLEQYSALFRATPWIVDRLWEAPWLLRAVSQRGVQTQPDQLGELTVSILEGHHGHQRKEFEKLVHWLQTQPSPDVIDVSNSMLISLVPALKEAIGCPVCCTLQGENVFLDQLLEPYRLRALTLMREHAKSVDRFIAVSDYYAAYMSQYLHIPGALVDVVPLGIHVDGFSAVDTNPNAPFTIGYLGRIAPEKGVHLLCEAYHRLRIQGELEDCRLELAGYLGPEHRAYIDGIIRQIDEWKLSDEISYHGVLDFDEKVAFLSSLDIFAVPATYDDPKGLALVEAMASGVPVVATKRGTYVELIERTGGGILTPPDELESFMGALVRLRTDETVRREIAIRGLTAVRANYTADAMAKRALDVYQSLVSTATN